MGGLLWEPDNWSGSAPRVGAVKMRLCPDEAQQVFHGGRLVADTALGAMGVEPVGVAAWTGQDDVSPELWIAAGDAPPAGTLGPVLHFRRLVFTVGGIFPDVEAVGQRARVGRALALAGCWRVHGAIPRVS